MVYCNRLAKIIGSAKIKETYSSKSVRVNQIRIQILDKAISSLWNNAIVTSEAKLRDFKLLATILQFQADRYRFTSINTTRFIILALNGVYNPSEIYNYL